MSGIIFTMCQILNLCWASKKIIFFRSCAPATKKMFFGRMTMFLVIVTFAALFEPVACLIAEDLIAEELSDRIPGNCGRRLDNLAVVGKIALQLDANRAIQIHNEDQVANQAAIQAKLRELGEDWCNCGYNSNRFNLRRRNNIGVIRTQTRG